MSEIGGLMAIDDPVGIEIRQANAEIEAESDVPIRLTKLGLSGALAAAMASMPFVSQVLISQCGHNEWPLLLRGRPKICSGKPGPSCTLN